MFNSEIFHTEVYPDFNEAFQAKLRVYNKDTQTIKIIDTIDIKKLPIRESILVKALVDVSLLKETAMLEKKQELQKNLQEKWKKEGQEDFKLSLQIIVMIESKNKKIKFLKSYQKELEYKLMQF